jgi:hypothetical protein
MNKTQEQTIVDKVSIEIATICKFYDIDFYLLDKKTINAFVEVFQLGVGYIEKIKQEDIAKSIKEVNKQFSLENKPLQSDISHSNLKDE